LSVFRRVVVKYFVVRFKGIPYDPKAYDVWALGVVLYLMLADVMPYPYNNWRQIVASQMARKFAKPKRFISQDAIRLIT